ncbi:MAG: hypothetical protein JWN14_1009 [Chthonomonadales bacterium]|nr:hypothetical protein [Chthonomonadales bacterium]
MLSRLFARAVLPAATSTLIIGILHTASAQDLYAADQGTRSISWFTPGGVQSTFATGLRNPSGLAFAPSAAAAATPEPGFLALLTGLGCTGTGLFLRRRARRRRSCRNRPS